ncbi:hypothetical protein Tco_0095428 [Tanacetum coccineum]
MAAPTIHVSAEENLRDPIDIKVDIIHPEPVAVVAFLAAVVVRIQAQHGDAIQGIQEHLLGVPIQEELTGWFMMRSEGFGIGVGELTLSSLDVLQGFSLFLHMGFTLILATLDGLDVSLLEDVFSEDDYDYDG